MTEQLSYKIMLAADGGMTICPDIREVFITDNDMATAMGEWILTIIKNACQEDAEVTVTINMNDSEQED